MLILRLYRLPLTKLIFLVLIALISISSVQRVHAATLDPAFGTGGRATASVTNQAMFGGPVYIQPSGRIVVVETLYGVGGEVMMRSIALFGFSTDGLLDPEFGTGGKTFIGTLGYDEINYAGSAMQSDGKILVYYSTYFPDAPYTDFRLLRFTADGQPDPTFSAGVPRLGYAPGQILGVVASPDGKVTIIAGGTTLRLMRFNSDGSRDQSFGTNGEKPWPVLRLGGSFNGMALDSKGKLIIGSWNGSVARVDQNGDLDRSFGRQGVASPPQNVGYGPMIRQPDGKILFTTGGPNMGLFRYTERGRPDATFGINGYVNPPLGPTTSTASSLALQPDGKIIVGGRSKFYGTGDQLLIAKYAVDGTLEQYSPVLFPDFTNFYVGSVALQPDGRIIVAGAAAPPTIFTPPYPGKLAVVRLKDTKFGNGPLARSNDFDGDGRTDLSVYRHDPAGVEQSFWDVSTRNGTSLQTYFGISEDIPVPQDYDDDGKTDVAVFRPSNGTWYYKTDFAADDLTEIQFGQTGDIPVPNDYDGDRITDLAVFRPATATWYVRNSSSGTITVKQFGDPAQTPLTGDLDGDGKADMTVWDKTTARFTFIRSSDGLVFFRDVGAPGDTPVIADLDGDRISDLATFTSAGIWRYVRSSDGQTVITSYGQTGDIPVPGDFSGDGKADIGVFRPSEGNWSVTWTGGGFVTQFGQDGDVPLPGR